MKIFTSNEVIGAHPFLHLDYLNILKLEFLSWEKARLGVSKVGFESP
jgi:hypothetical protein